VDFAEPLHWLDIADERRARARAKAEEMARAMAQAHAKAKAQLKAMPKAMPKAKAQAKAQADGQAKAKAKAKVKAVPHVMARPAGALRRAQAFFLAPDSQSTGFNISSSISQLPGSPAQDLAFIPMPDSPAMGSNSPGTSSHSSGFCNGPSP